ncbi:MAG: GtrA family protein [Myxococcales bacterium]|nr:GtrA family protein [Myxococcales bacterium]
MGDMSASASTNIETTTAPRRGFFSTLSRSAAVGVVATAVDVLALTALVSWLGWSARHANIPSLLLGVAVQYAGNKRFAFGDRSRNHLRTGGLFGLVEVGALALNAGLFHLACGLFEFPVALIRLCCSALVYFGFSFPLWRLIFRNRPEAKQGEYSCGTSS